MILVVVTTDLEGVGVEGSDVGVDSAGVLVALETDGDWVEELEVLDVWVASNIESGEAPSGAGAVPALACAALNPPKPMKVMTASVDRMNCPPPLCHRGRGAPKVGMRGCAALTAALSLKLPPGFSTLNLPDVDGFA